MLAACAGTAVESFTMSPPETPGGRQCTIQCQSARDYCEQGCTLETRACYGNIQEQALLDYDKYVREQVMARAPTDLHASDFERHGSCDSDKKSCTDRCANHYRSCYQDCGGEITTTTSCVFLCF